MKRKVQLSQRLNAGSLARLSMLIAAMIVFSLTLSAQNVIELDASKSKTQVVKNDFQSLQINYTFDALHTLEVKTRQGTFHELILPQGYPVGKPGDPKLPAAKDLIEIPFGAEVEVVVKSYTTKEYDLADYDVKNPIMPNQPSLRKDQNVEDVPFQFNHDAYTKNAFAEMELAEVEVLGVMRGVRLAHITVAPVRYNPAEQTLKVYNDVELEIHFKGADKALTQHVKASTYSPYFDMLYSSTLNEPLSGDIFDDYPDLTKTPVKMLVVSDREFEQTLEPFIAWKTKTGYHMNVAYTDEIGSSATEVQDWIHEQYNAGTPEDPAPTFVVIVGDVDKVPASAIGDESGLVTDLYYASADGDYFPDMYLGRLSARNVQELQNQLDKILYYQKYEFDDPSYLDDVTLIAGQDGYWNPNVGQPTIHYATENYFNEAHGFNNVNAYLSSYSGCYDEERIAVSLINFTAHCSPTSWAGPYLTVSDIHNMTNEGKYPLAVGNCCQSALFSHSESVGEAWVRAQDKGAVAYIGSAPNTHWFEDFYWALGAFPIQGDNNGYVPSVEETTMGAYDASFVSDYQAVASVKFVGNLAITEAHIQGYQTHVSNAQYYWEGYQTFGDPSTYIYKTQGTENQVSHMDILPIGLDTYTVEALPGSYVAISKDGVLHGAAIVDEMGEVEVPIDPVLEGGDVNIVVTGPKLIPYIETVPAAALDGPFVVLDDFDINGEPAYNQSITLDVTLKNVGSDAVGNVTAVLEGDDPYITLLNAGDEITFEGMEAGEQDNTSFVAEAFAMDISQDVPDNHQASFELTITDGGEEWVSNLRLNAYAPVFSIDPDYVLDDSEYGDGNNRLDPGESALLTFQVTNQGHTTAVNPVFEIMGNSPYLSLDDFQYNLEPIAAGDTTDVEVWVHAHESAAEGTFVDLTMHIEDGHWAEASTEIVIGQVPEMQLGEGDAESGQYPFYNYYKANRTQMLYLNSELGSGEKIIKEVGFDIKEVADDHQNLPNFKIFIKHTDVETMPNAYVDMSEATEVFSADTYQMPEEEGWHMWEIEDYAYDGESNIVVEIVWGQLDGWTWNHYKVNSTGMDHDMVSYGYDDNEEIPSYSGSSNVRPNLFLAFQEQGEMEEQQVTFIAKNQHDETIEEATLHIATTTLQTDESGQAALNLFPGTYTLNATADGYQAIEEHEFVVGEGPLELELVFDDIMMEVLFIVDDTHGDEVHDAVVTLNEEPQEPGEYHFEEVEPGTHNYVVSHEQYFDSEGSFELIDQNLEIHVTLSPDDTYVADMESSPRVTLFPNPTRGDINIRLNGFEGELEVSIANYQGQILQSRVVEAFGGQQQIRLKPDYSPGVYYLRVSKGEDTWIKKVIIQ